MVQGAPSGPPLPLAHPGGPHSRGWQASVQWGDRVRVQQQQEAGEECSQRQPLGHGLPALLLRQRHLRHLGVGTAGQALGGGPRERPPLPQAWRSSGAALDTGPCLHQLSGPQARCRQRDKLTEGTATGLHTETAGNASAEQAGAWGKETFLLLSSVSVCCFFFFINPPQRTCFSC